MTTHGRNPAANAALAQAATPSNQGGFDAERAVLTRPTGQSPWWLWPLIFAAGLTLARVLWSAIFNHATLAEDEAYYWEWARHLDWSYSTKGPGVAWLIAASTGFFGTAEWTVRLPAAIAAGVGSILAAGAAREMARPRAIDDTTNHLAPLLAAIAYQCVPAFQITGYVMTIDGPMLAAWMGAVWAAAAIVRTGSLRAWVGFGIAMAIGVLFKYTILLVPLGLAICLLRGKWGVDRAPVRGKHMGIALGIAAIGVLPIVVWNMAHDWLSVRHLLGHLGLPGGDRPGPSEPWHYTPMWTLEFVGLLLSAGGPLIALGVFGLLNRARALRPGMASLTLWLALPTAALYFFVSFVTEVEANWAIGAYAALVPAGAAAVAEGWSRRDHPVRFAAIATAVAGALVLLAFPLAEPLRPLLVASPRFGERIERGMSRMSGMRDVARHAEMVLLDLRTRSGEEPIVMADHYGRAAQLAFYLEGRPTVYCASSLDGAGRPTQYDIWRSTDLRSPPVAEALRGRPGLLFGGEPSRWTPMFQDVTDIGPLEGEPKTNRTTYIARDYDPAFALHDPHPHGTGDEESAP